MCDSPTYQRVRSNPHFTMRPLSWSFEIWLLPSYVFTFVFFPSIRSSELVHRLGYLAFTEKSRVRFPDSEIIFLHFVAPSHFPYWERQTEAATDVFWPQCATNPKELDIRFHPRLHVQEPRIVSKRTRSLVCLHHFIVIVFCISTNWSVVCKQLLQHI